MRNHHKKGNLYFNSIKVRLKLEVVRPLAIILSIFQFHKGTIKTVVSHKLKGQNDNFNSIKVRLKLQPYL